MHPTFQGLGFLRVIYMATKLIFITGGARSGKSRFAQRLADGMKGRKVFIATAQPLDEEMRVRIEKHKKERPLGWDAVEEPKHLCSAIKKCEGKYDVILMECLTMWISNHLTQFNTNETEILEEVNRLVACCENIESAIIIVSNEVGLAIVPEDSLSRLFRDIAGFANQKIASLADEAYLVIAGLPLNLKN